MSDSVTDKLHLLNLKGDAVLCGAPKSDNALSMSAFTEKWINASPRAKLIRQLCERCRDEIPTLRREEKQRFSQWLEKQQAEAAAREAAERARLQADIDRSSPGFASPEAVSKNPVYKRITEVDGGTWPASRLLVVRHTGRDTLWACRYGIRDDDSDWDQQQRWFEVEEKKVIQTVYKRKA